MKIYISTDMEGLQGVNAWHHVNTQDKRFKGKYLTETLEWILEGIKKSDYNKDVKEILICDSHSLGENIPYDFTENDDRLYLISGGLRNYYMMAGLDQSFDCVFFVGYHGGVGSKFANMDHTYSTDVHELKINGMNMNETIINAAFAGDLNIPVALVVGDDILKNETQSILPETEFVVTKKDLSRFSAIMRPKNVLKREVIKSTIEALGKIGSKSVPSYKMGKPYLVEITFKSTEMADQSVLIPGIKRTGGFSIEYTTNSYPELMQTLLATVYSAGLAKKFGE